MAAGLGFKTFTTGEVLTAADTNGYLMQGVLVFASSAARAAAITSPQEGQYSYLKDTNSTEYYDGAAWIAAPIGDITGVTAGTGISGGGTSGTVTVTNSMATEITAAGDIIVGTGSGTFDNLPIGTTAQVLTADTTVSPYKVKWATPATAASGMTFIVSTAFSNEAGQAFDGVFTSTYRSYLIVINEIIAATGTDDLLLQWRYTGTTQSSLYYGANITASFASSTVTNVPTNNGTAATIGEATGAASDKGAGFFYVSQVAVSGGAKPIYNGMFFPAASSVSNQFGGYVSANGNYDGFRLSAASNITGRVTIYGLANA